MLLENKTSKLYSDKNLKKKP